MRITFVSNYINHHQIPFCNEMYKRLSDNFSFVETMPMEESRKSMGWEEEELPYVHRIYEDEPLCAELIQNSQVLILGWIGDDRESSAYKLTMERLLSGKPVIRISERIYREGRWKIISPKGLIAKWREHIRFRKMPVYMLCAGAYVSGDFKAIGAYPHKMYKWGYFPPLRRYEEIELSSMMYQNGEPLQICYAGRLIKLKHPELVIEAAAYLKEKDVDFHVHMVGDGNMRGTLEEMIENKGLSEYVTMYGSMEPDRVRDIMEKSHVFIFSSNYLEGWGAVVNEAMNSACAVIASSEAGCVPYLINEGENGDTFSDCNGRELNRKLYRLVTNPELIRRYQREAYETIESLWNAEVAADRCIRFSESIVIDRKDEEDFEYVPDIEGPLSRAGIYKPAGFLRSLKEDNHLE